MQKYVEVIDKEKNIVELKIDSSIFDIDTIMKASYELTDKVYMSFQNDDKWILVQFKGKAVDIDMEELVDSFGEELVFHRLRKQIDDKHGDLKSKIIETAIGYGITPKEVVDDVERLLAKISQGGSAPVDRSIDDVIQEIEDDPDFDEDRDEIIQMLKEIDN